MSPLPAWSAAFEDGRLATVLSLPLPDVREWAFGGATGAGVRVAVVDSGIDADHPRVSGVAGRGVVRARRIVTLRLPRRRGPAR